MRTFSFWDSYEVYLLRTNYEAVSVRLLNGKVPEETIQKMEEILESMRKIPAEEFESVFEYDNRFHEQLVLMSKLPRLAKVWKELYYGNLLAGYELVREKEQILARQYDNHIAILNACKEGDPEKICREVEKTLLEDDFPYDAGTEDRRSEPGTGMDDGNLKKEKRHGRIISGN